jgi:hypothetical protein
MVDGKKEKTQYKERQFSYEQPLRCQLVQAGNEETQQKTGEKLTLTIINLQLTELTSRLSINSNEPVLKLKEEIISRLHGGAVSLGELILWKGTLMKTLLDEQFKPTADQHCVKGDIQPIGEAFPQITTALQHPPPPQEGFARTATVYYSIRRHAPTISVGAKNDDYTKYDQDISFAMIVM